MLIGAHVSTSGGLAKAVSRGEEIGCRSIQIFNQSPRAWRPTAFTDEDFAAFREAMRESTIESVIIHAIYLINTATPDRDLARKSRESLIHALRVGDAIGADGVVLHPGSRKQEEVVPAIVRSGALIREALSESERCPVLIEQMAGHANILAHTFEEIAGIIEAAGGGKRLGLCLDSCHLYAAGYDIGSYDGIDRMLEDSDRALGKRRLRALHLNDSKEPLGSRRDRHADIGQGEVGETGMARFLSEPRFDGLPATMETPGPERKGPVAADLDLANRLRRRGQSARRRRKS
ncbi:MAG: deoxyribonuclease IV [Solirubrobacterales bacterium]|nr:deoxyribonuclease IV [Solirubrobacterales bacterium]